MEVNVSCLLGEVSAWDLSGSVATHGATAGPDTWAASEEAAKGRDLEGFTVDGARSWAEGFGAWDSDELDAMGAEGLKALVLQYAAGDLNELRALCPGDGLADVNWRKAEKLANAGTVGGNLFAHGDQLMIYLE